MIVPAVAMGIALVSRDRRLVAAAAVLAVLQIAGPWMVVLVVAAAVPAAIARKRARSRRSAGATNGIDELVAVRATSLGVAAGLGYDQAAREAASAAGGEVGAALSETLRRRAAGLQRSSGFDALDAMEVEAHRSALTGAPLGPALDALEMSIRRERAERARTRLARLPVKLLFPLAFLILPGFVLMSVGPAVLGGLARLDL